MSDKADPANAGDFAALFAQLDSAAACAPLDGGLHRLLHSIDALKRPQPDYR